MTKLESRRMWNRDAENWTDQSHLGPLANEIQKYGLKLVREALTQVPDELPIIDLGTGANTKGYFDLQHYSRIIGVDSAEKMLTENQLRKKVLAEMSTTLPFKSNSVGLITSFLSMRYLNRKEHLDLIKEATRILVPGGILLLVDLPLNKWDYQYSSFHPEHVATAMKNLGYTNVIFQDNHLSVSTSDGSGFGGKVTYSTYIGMVRGEKDEKTKQDQVNLSLASDYLIPEEDGTKTIKVKDTRKAPPF